MYEDITYEVILERMLNRITEKYPEMDTREGSVLFNALAPAAAELQNMYIALECAMNEAFADTANREYLILRAKERGLTPYPATKAIRQGEFNCDVPIGARFSLNSLHYTVLEKRSDGSYRLECETVGSAGNMENGTLTSVEYIDGLDTARLTAVLVPGEDDEDTEAFRKRYFESLHSQAFGGNKADYAEKTCAIAGVGGVKVYPAWAGAGTVKICILDAAWGCPSGDLLQTVQTAVDPPENSGAGDGFAPIGHMVTVTPVRGREVAVSMRLSYQSGWGWEDVRDGVEEAIAGYFSSLSQTWADEDRLIVRISGIETRILSLPGILDVHETRLDGAQQNLQLSEDEIPLPGEVTCVG